jgi:hypothetical protein
VETILPIVLTGTLAAVVAALAAMGILQRMRRAALERLAHESGMHFSEEDTFDVPRRCAAFALCCCGHSPLASNVTYGRMRGLPVRAFDFRYEIAHGTHRATRRYGVVLLDASPDAGAGSDSSRPAGGVTLMWNRRDAAHAPPAMQAAGGMAGEWSCRGDAAEARRLADLCGPLAETGVSVESRPEGLMLWFPARRGRRTRQDWLWAAERLLGALETAQPDAGAPRGNR